MGQDVFKPKGKLKKNQPGAGQAQTQDVPIICTVMNNIDPTNSGRLDVYPSESLDKAAYDKSSWISVRRLNTFFGAVKPTGASDELGSYVNNPSSYGQWNAPPDKGTKVVCIFINGDMNYGFYIGSVSDGSELQMIPAVGSTDKIIANEGEAQSYGGATILPVTNINTNNKDVNDNPDYLKAAKPIHSYSATIMHQQGILRDRIRGPISSSASRESTSRVGWGVSTPGRPIYTGGFTDETLPENLDADPENVQIIARRGGHSIVMDDGDIIGRDQLIRIRTALGHQILMSDDGQTLMLLHSNGQSYIELGKEGTVDVFATNSINFRTQGDLNLHADNMVNIHAGKDININATENINVNSDKKWTQRVGENYELYSLTDLLFKSDTNIALDAASKASVKAAGETYIEGAKVHLNDGSAGISPPQIEPIPIVKHTDTLFDEVTGWSAAPGKLDSITSRAPAHTPWLGAGQGVDVQVSSNADDALPPPPESNITTLNDQAATLDTGNVVGVSQATMATVPEVGAVSGAIDKNATTAMIAGVATVTQKVSSYANAATQGFTTITQTINSAGQQATSAIVGAFAQSASQLASGGVLKPGSNNMVNTLVASGMDVVDAMPQSIFTGQNGVNDLNSLVSSVDAQAKSVVKNLQQAQTGLTLAGAITGKEAAGGIAGVVQAAAGGAADLASVGSKVSTVASAVKDGISGSAGDFGSKVLTDMKSGISSAVASTITGGLGGVSKALDAIGKINEFGNSLDVNIGPVASAFKTITKTFKPFQANVPQDLTEIAKTQAASVIAGASGLLGAGAVAGAVDASNKIIGAIGGSTGSLLAQANGLSSAAAQIQSGASAAASTALATGLKDLPGGTSIAGAIVDNASNAVNKVVDNISSVTNEINNLTATAFSGGAISNVNLPGGDALSGISSAIGASLPPGAQAALESALASMTSGGGSTVKLPTIAFNTFDRSSITNAIGSVLGPDVIPRPNLLGVISSTALDLADTILSQQKELGNLTKALTLANKATALAQSAYSDALSSLPEGDPQIAALKSAFETALSAETAARGVLESTQNAAAAANAALTQQRKSVGAAPTRTETAAAAAAALVALEESRAREEANQRERLAQAAATNDLTNALAGSTSISDLLDNATDNNTFNPNAINAIPDESALLGPDINFDNSANGEVLLSSFENFTSSNNQPNTDEVSDDTGNLTFGYVPTDEVVDDGEAVPQNTVDGIVGPPADTLPNTVPGGNGGGGDGGVQGGGVLDDVKNSTTWKSK